MQYALLFLDPHVRVHTGRACFVPCSGHFPYLRRQGSAGFWEHGLDLLQWRERAHSWVRNFPTAWISGKRRLEDTRRAHTVRQVLTVWFCFSEYVQLLE